MNIGGENIFSRIPQLGLPSLVESYLLYNVSLDTETEDETDPVFSVNEVCLYSHWRPLVYQLGNVDCWGHVKTSQIKTFLFDLEG